MVCQFKYGPCQVRIVNGVPVLILLHMVGTEWRGRRLLACRIEQNFESEAVQSVQVAGPRTIEQDVHNRLRPLRKQLNVVQASEPCFEINGV